MNKRIAIIGAGKLGLALAKGWTLSSANNADKIILSDKRTDINEQDFQIIHDNVKAVQQAYYILVAVKPHHAKEVIEELKNTIREDQTILTVMMGISIENICTWLGRNQQVIRVMPNIAAATCESMTCLAFSELCDEKIKKEVQDLFQLLGEVAVIEEQLMNAATVMTGSAIAFAMRYARAIMQGGISIGFDSKTSLLLATQVMKSAAGLLLTSSQHPEALIDQVTTPKGCTIAGLNEMETRGLSAALIKGVAASYERII